MKKLVAVVVVAAGVALGGTALAGWKYNAVCATEHAEPWLGPDRASGGEARADADAHMAQNPGHVASVYEQAVE